MIELVYPQSGADKYLLYLGVLLGPYKSGYVATDTSSFNGSMSYFKQKKGMYHENGVLHEKISGKFSYYPMFDNVTPAPTASYPRRIQFLVKETPVTQTSLWGFMADGCVSIGGFPSTIEHRVLRFDPSKGWTLYVMTVRSDTFKFNSVTEYRIGFNYTLTSGYNGYVNQTTRNAVNLGSLPRHADWSHLQPLVTYLEYIGYMAWGNPISSQAPIKAFSAVSQTLLSPGECVNRIDRLMYSLLPEYFPIPEKHYGDLAMNAAKQKPANTVNMFEFLRDIRHISSVVPKLKNLTNLKGIAGQYLSVKYGVLPTISDLQQIYSAVKKRKAFFDRNGFQVFNAGHHVSEFDGQLHFDLDQYVKLAIGDEDNLFEELIERLDDIGLLPTFENLWDLARYSFVIDWFVDVGGFLERIDNRLRLARYNIKYATMSRKRRIHGYSVGTPTYPFIGAVVWEEYHRWVTGHCPLPPLSLQVNPIPTQHWLEGTALIIQRI